MKPQSGSRQHQLPPETPRGAGAVRHTTNVLQIFQLVLRLRLLPQELRSYDPQGASLRPLVQDSMVRPLSRRFPPSPLFHARSTRYLPRSHRKRSAPSREEPLLQPAKAQSFDALRVQSTPMPRAPLRQDDAQSGRSSQRKIVLGLIRTYHSALSPARSLAPLSLRTRRSLQGANRKELQR